MYGTTDSINFPVIYWQRVDRYTPRNGTTNIGESVHIDPKSTAMCKYKSLLLRCLVWNQNTKYIFAYAAPTLWNKPPIECREAGSVEFLKDKLKTHLFKK